MSANKQGIQLEKRQIKALLAFAGSAERNLDVVHFRVPAAGANLIVNVTDGHRALEVIFTTDDPHCVVGEWSVSVDFLSACYRALKAGQVLLLRVKKNGLRIGSLLDAETLEEKNTLTCPTEAASTQVTMKTISDIMRVAQDARQHRGSWYAVQGRYLADIKIVAQACGDKTAAVTIYPPQAPDQAIGFEAKTGGVTWTGLLMPVRVEAPGLPAQPDDDETDDPDGPDGEPVGVAEAVENLKEVLAEHGATLTVTTGDTAEGASA